MAELSQQNATAITQLWSDYGAAFARGDASAIAALFARDGDLTAVDGTRADGPEAIAAYYRDELLRKHEGVTLHSIELDPPRDVSTDVALMNATWLVHGVRPEPFRVRTTFVVRREPNGWRYVAARFAAALRLDA